MGKSAKFFKRPTRKEKAVLSLSKGGAETSLFDAATSEGRKGGPKKDVLSATANPTIAKKSSSAAAHPPKASLAYKMQLNGGIKQAVKDLENLDNEDLVSEDEDMDRDTVSTSAATGSSQAQQKKSGDMDKTKPRPDYVELMYGKQRGNKRKTFMPKPALIK
ncbi:hypothetical protein BGZ70_001785 [Mortierella alpina]|uniref:Uncharacterized protein n=1 Tax=Mortierella alpina TaxID=64518 RepID=A0A9P6M5R3_MORAP|nr:hypothetical protein BGZ70_001785 [Mortierella alpina]